MKSGYFFFLLLIFSISLQAYSQESKVTFKCNNQELTRSFEWAKNKALSYAHDGADPVGFWYEAALPNREAFCMRDVSHQAIGAQILGLGKQNLNMFLKFAQNISESKDYCSYWEINRYNKPAPVDFENDKDFWYNLPANFDVTYNAWRLYNWTGNREYIDNSQFQHFYKLSLNNYVERWELGHDKVLQRNRLINVEFPDDPSKTRFYNKRGIPTYNEGGRGETLLGIDMTASLIAAYKAYATILKAEGKTGEAEKYAQKAREELQFLNRFWWDNQKQQFKSILYGDGTFDYFMVGKNQAFLHYILYFNAENDPSKIKSIVNDYIENYPKLIVELKSYLPILFYENGRSDIASKMVVELCSDENHRRDYPENSFTVIEDITRGLMGIQPEAAANEVSTSSRLEKETDWAEMSHVPVLSNEISVKHEGNKKTTLINQSGPEFTWKIEFPGVCKNIFVNGKKYSASVSKDQRYSWIIVNVHPGETVVAQVKSGQ